MAQETFYFPFAVFLRYFCCRFVAGKESSNKSNNRNGKIKRTNKTPTKENADRNHVPVPRHLHQRKEELRVPKAVPRTREDKSRQGQEPRDAASGRNNQGEKAGRVPQRRIRTEGRTA